MADAQPKKEEAFNPFEYFSRPDVKKRYNEYLKNLKNLKKEKLSKQELKITFDYYCSYNRFNWLVERMQSIGGYEELSMKLTDEEWVEYMEEHQDELIKSVKSWC
ncbi:MAG: hypothetical protein K9W44_01285 [Candidatus Lokiarchaeota archaeon]|nr:hypothetical protein [Candidatus Harpocratesius repetitus]